MVGYLTLARGLSWGDALAVVRHARPQANPYEVPWAAARAQLLAGREQELYGRAAAHAAAAAAAARGGAAAGEYRGADGGAPPDAAPACGPGSGGDWIGRDWAAAEREALGATFARRADTDVALVRGALAAAASGVVA